MVKGKKTMIVYIFKICDAGVNLFSLKNTIVLEKMNENIHFVSSTIPVYIRKE